MKGTIITIPVIGDITSEDVNTAHIYEKLRTAVGGYIEQVPLFHTFMWNNEKRRCVVFCNEEGKVHDLPVNHRATFYWLNSLGHPIEDVLMGDVAVVIGDDEFMKDL
jgi:hypothetical protein